MALSKKQLTLPWKPIDKISLFCTCIDTLFIKESLKMYIFAHPKNINKSTFLLKGRLLKCTV